MTRRQAILVLTAAFALLGALNALAYAIYRDAARTVGAELDARLDALGRTAADWMQSPSDAALRALAEKNRLEDAYVFDRSRRVLAGAHTPAGTTVSLLRLDGARVDAALAGRPSVAWGYSLEGVHIESGYFGVARGSVLALEAGAGYRAPARRVRDTWFLGIALSLALAVLFALGLFAALRAQARAQRSERMALVGQMAAMVAHEVRNPLGILKMQTERLGEKLGGDMPARERERIGEMLGEIERISRLTSEFLTLARETPLELAEADVGRLVEETVDAARSAHPHIESRLPEERLCARVDADKLRQVMLNLVLNAVQMGGSAVQVRVVAEKRDGRIEVRVSDDGPGVPEELRPGLFEPFVSNRPGGSGLGLAVARQIVERHGGKLMLLPSSRGATFAFTIPAGDR
jgi:two-component system, OmpR family, sensor kinase